MEHDVSSSSLGSRIYLQSAPYCVRVRANNFCWNFIHLFEHFVFCFAFFAIFTHDVYSKCWARGNAMNRHLQSLADYSRRLGAFDFHKLVAHRHPSGAIKLKLEIAIRTDIFGVMRTIRNLNSIHKGMNATVACGGRRKAKLLIFCWNQFRDAAYTSSIWYWIMIYLENLSKNCGQSVVCVMKWSVWWTEWNNFSYFSVWNAVLPWPMTTLFCHWTTAHENNKEKRPQHRRALVGAICSLFVHCSFNLNLLTSE